MSGWYIFLFLVVVGLQNQGASTVVYCATTNELKALGGLYFNNCQECEPSPKANDLELARLLWKKSDDMINNSQLKQQQLHNQYF